MGLESATYMFTPDVEGLDIDDLLRRLGCRPGEASGAFRYWVLETPRHWIDFQLGLRGDGGRAGLSIRIALSNPSDVHQELRRILLYLFDHAAGTVFDLQTRRKYSDVSDQTWQELETAFDAKRSQFQQYFGPIEAPISGDKVFDLVHKLRGVNPDEKKV